MYFESNDVIFFHQQEPNEMTQSHPEGAYANMILPNDHHPHHHHTGHRGVFEDFAC